MWAPEQGALSWATLLPLGLHPDIWDRESGSRNSSPPHADLSDVHIMPCHFAECLVAATRSPGVNDTDALPTLYEACPSPAGPGCRPTWGPHPSTGPGLGPAPRLRPGPAPARVCDASAPGANPAARQARARLHRPPAIGPWGDPGRHGSLKTPRVINKEMWGRRAVRSSCGRGSGR